MLPLTPTKLGRYEIVDEIGKGAMGVVYLARDPLIGRLVALKTFRIGYSVRDQELEQFRVRFIREAQSAGILSHPNIVTIHDVVEEGDEGLAFIAMEYVRGTNLKVLLQGEQPLTLPFVADVVSQVAEALDYAHSHRVIHRDVKPANLLITADNRVKITDFGIARLDTSNLTQEGQLLGTPNYMAPEQIQGKEVDHRADLFALGVVLYEMLTRHKPFQGENLTVVSHRIVYDHFTPPREFIREMPPGIEPILDRALQKDPSRRYQRAREMVDDLRRVAGAASAADLNETQSVAMMAPVPPLPTLPPLVPPPAIPDATGALPPPVPAAVAAVAAASPAAAARTAKPAKPPKPPKPAKPPKAQAPPRPPRTGPPVSLRRVAMAGGAGALVVLLFGAAALLGLAWSTPGKGRNPRQDADQAGFITSIRTGHQLLRAGDPAGAAAAYLQAEKLASGATAARVRGLRVIAEKQAGEFGRLEGEEKIKAAQLMAAQQALEVRHWDDAIAAANSVLALDPANLMAQQIVASAQGFQTKARERVAANARTPHGGPQPEPMPVQPVVEPPLAATGAAPEPVSQEATLHVKFESELPGASVIVYIGSEKILQESVGDRGGFFRRARGSAPFEGSYQVKSGSASIRVYVTPPGEKALVRNVAGNFLGGESRHLDIRLSAAKEPSVNLR